MKTLHRCVTPADMVLLSRSEVKDELHRNDAKVESLQGKIEELRGQREVLTTSFIVTQLEELMMLETRYPKNSVKPDSNAHHSLAFVTSGKTSGG